MSENLNDIPIRSEENEFEADEMVDCGSCGRKSPPNRIDCIYCGSKVEIDEETLAKLKPVLRQPDEDEDGVSLVLTDGEPGRVSEAIGFLKHVTKIGEDTLQLIGTQNSALPVAFTNEGSAIEIVIKKLHEMGFGTAVVSDEDLSVEVPPVRLRRIERTENGDYLFIHFNNDEVELVSADAVRAVVLGELSESTYESHEKHKRKKGLDKVLGTTEARDVEHVIDIYAGTEDSGYRIAPKGFDFSFLGEKKSFLAKENLELTRNEIIEWVGESKLNQDYKVVRPLLDQIWMPMATDSTKSIKRTGFGNFEKKRLVSSTNDLQLLRFSRLQNLFVQTEERED